MMSVFRALPFSDNISWATYRDKVLVTKLQNHLLDDSFYSWKHIIEKESLVNNLLEMNLIYSKKYTHIYIYTNDDNPQYF